MELAAIREAAGEDLRDIDEVILKRLQSDVVLVNQIGRYIIDSGGKRLRPLIVALSARASGYEGRDHIELAAVVEFIHTATLLHDDVVDGSELRRNRETANAVWGNEASVLVGDFLYSRAFEMMVAIGNMRVMDILSRATNRIAEGEVLQLLNCNDPDTTEHRYMEVIKRKTATLFEAGTRLGAVLAGSDRAVEDRLAEYGQCLGVAFQLVDDALDYRGTEEELGKHCGDDLAEGKPTLPVIRAMEAGSDEQRAKLRRAIETGGLEDIAGVLEAIESTRSIDYTIELARTYARNAKDSLSVLKDSSQRRALEAIADFAVVRTF